MAFRSARRDMDNWNISKSGERGKKVPNYVLHVAECLDDLYSPSNVTKVENLISTSHQKEFDLKIFR